jgi:iron complex transport system substrate-binding protein
MTRRSLFCATVLFQIVILVTISACTQPSSPITDPPVATTEVAGIALVDGMGRTIQLEKPAGRIVSLAPANTEILFAIGAGEQVVGRDTFSDFPDEAKQVTDVGGGFGELNSEVILSLKPDLVIVSSLTPPEQIKALEDLGLVTFVLPNPKDFEGLYTNLEAVAALSGHEKEAAALVESIKKRVAAVQEKISKITERPLVFYEIDGTDPNAIWTPGPETFVATLIRMAGGDNLGDVLTTDWAQISLEELVAREPSIILLGDWIWGGVTPESASARPGWDAIKAVQEGKVFAFDDNLVSRPGPRLVEGLEGMANLLHPELFE